jgi:putative ABC transport system permease protein
MSDPRDRDRDLAEEIEAHLRMAADERMARGESRAAAESAARREFGNPTHVMEVTREQRRGVWLERLLQDVRYGIRSLRRTPAFTVTALLTLALAIGANSAVFSVVRGVLLRPLPFPEPERLFLVSYLPTDMPFELGPGMVDRQWLEYRGRQHSFVHVATYDTHEATLSGAGDAERFTGARVEPAFFAVMGVQPAIGRAFAADERDDSDVVILGDHLWRTRFGADPAVTGRTVTLNGEPRVVIGIMPPAFNFPDSSAFWMPLTIRLDAHNSFIPSVIGRLARGVSAADARSEVAAIIRSMPGDGNGFGDHKPVAAVLPLKDAMTGHVATSLLLLTGAVGFVLMIACANVANLLLIRAASRRREMAVRIALGASRLRLARQVLTESALLGLVGAALGIAIAAAGVRALLAIAPQGHIPRTGEVHVDGWVVAFTVGVSLLASVAFGLAPAIDGARRAPAESIGNGARTVGGATRLRGALVTAEIALALVLLSAAGLLINSFLRIRGADKGYDGRHIVAMNVDLPAATYPDLSRQRAFHARMIAALAALPGVRHAAAVSFKPMSGVDMMGDFVVEGQTPLPHGYSVDKTLVSPGYFSAMGMHMVAGRDFSETDAPGAPLTVVVSERLASSVWPGLNPLGRRVKERDSLANWMTVVGVVNDVAQDRSLAPHSTMYFPYQQSTFVWMTNHMTYVVRADAGARIAPAMRAALRNVDPTVPAQRLQTMDQALLDAVSEPLFQTRLLAVFAAVAMLLAAIGTYGVLAYDVAERSREIALRLALGAEPRDVIRMVLWRTSRLALPGAALGILAALSLTRLLSASLYGVRPGDPLTIGLVAVLILGVALLAGYAPARRASRVRILSALSVD